jgi:uncharacterized protein YycO
MKLASYKASKGGLIDRLIAVRHFGKYSHSELIFSDGTAWSSSNRDHGVRFKKIDFDHKWDVLDLPISFNHEICVREWCRQQVGKGYDWDGIFTFVNPFARQDEPKMFCSEACCAALQQAGLFMGINPWKVWPSRLHKMVQSL